MSRSAKIPVPINDGLPVKYLALLAMDLKARILKGSSLGRNGPVSAFTLASMVGGASASTATSAENGTDRVSRKRLPN
jgi:hypothetical protein